MIFLSKKRYFHKILPKMWETKWQQFPHIVKTQCGKARTSFERISVICTLCARVHFVNDSYCKIFMYQFDEIACYIRAV